MSTVRELAQSDAEGILHVMQESFKEYTTFDFSYETELESVQTIQDEMRSGTGVLGVFLGSDLTGVVKYRPEDAGEYLYFSRLSVLPQFRGKGYADLLLSELETIAIRHGLMGLSCTVVPKDRSLLAFYGRRGMVEVGEVPLMTFRGEQITVLRLETHYSSSQKTS